MVNAAGGDGPVGGRTSAAHDAQVITTSDASIRAAMVMHSLQGDYSKRVHIEPGTASSSARLSRLASGHDLAVVLDAEWVRSEHEGILAVVERIEEDAERISIREVGVAAALADQDVLRLAIEADHGYRVSRSTRNLSSVRSVARSPSFGSC